jgi:hypothetical protein
MRSIVGSKKIRVNGRKGCGDDREIGEEVGDVFGKGANEKSNCDVGRANLDKARWFASTELPAS